MSVTAIRRVTGPGLWAWLASGTLHALLVLFAAKLPSPSPEEPFEPIRVAMVEPPPLPLGLPEAETKPEAPPVPVVKSRPKPAERPARPAPAAETTPVVPEAPEKSPVAVAEMPPAADAGPAEPVALRGRADGAAGGLRGGLPGGRGDTPVPVGRVARPPQLLTRIPPEYPWRARSEGLEGEVLLEAVVDRRGRVENRVVVLESVPGLDEAALAAVRRWRFRPARDERDRAVRVIVEIPIRFVLR